MKLEESRMPNDEPKEIVHYDKDGKKYYTLDVHDIDDMKISRFYSPAEGMIFTDAPPITEEDRKEADRLWDSIALPGTSPGTVTPKKKKH
jgi:hypothetical protein